MKICAACANFLRELTKDLLNHEDLEGHEGRIREIRSQPKNYLFLRGLRALRGARFFGLVAAEPRFVLRGGYFSTGNSE